MLRTNGSPMSILETSRVLGSLTLLAAACSGPQFTTDVSQLAGGGNAAVGSTSSLSSPDADANALHQATSCGTGRIDATARTTEICIVGSQFIMGSSQPNISGGFVDHTPAHTVTVSAYFIDAFEVTVARYRQCVDAGVCSAPTGTGPACTFSASAGSRENDPITCVPYASAAAFCKWDGSRRLPTEAEWERAARGTSGTNYPWGETFDCTRAVAATALSCVQYESNQPSEVGSAPAGSSPEGVADLIGNAAEWVADYVGSYVLADGATNPLGPVTGTQRVVRGGDWSTPVEQTYAYLRRSALPTSAGSLGFRCARSAQ
jgi:formylglycine-generating enzyme required for sulfatase activity